jgi:hypothetical protein
LISSRNNKRREFYFYVVLKIPILKFILQTPLVSKAYASHTIIPDIFQTNPFVQPTFLLQLKKVGKKSRSPNYALHPIIRQI